MESQGVSIIKKKLMSVVVASAIILPLSFGQALAQFIIADDAAHPQQDKEWEPSPPDASSQGRPNSGSSIQVVPTPKAKNQPAQAQDAASSKAGNIGAGSPLVSPIKKVSIKNANQYRSDFPDRLTVQQKGRMPTLLGRTIQARDGNLADILTASVPDGFQVYVADGVDMDLQLPGEDGNWVEIIRKSLVGTPYIAVIDWDKREVDIKIDPIIKQAEDAKAAAKKADEEAKAAAQKQADEAKIATQKAADAAKKLDDEAKVAAQVRADEVKKLADEAAAMANHWHVSRNDGLLSIVLENWCKKATGQCVQFINQSSHDVPIDSDADFNGTFKQSVTDLMASVSKQVGRRFKWYLTSNNVLIMSDDLIRD